MKLLIFSVLLLAQFQFVPTEALLPGLIGPIPGVPNLLDPVTQVQKLLGQITDLVGKLTTMLTSALSKLTNLLQSVVESGNKFLSDGISQIRNATKEAINDLRNLTQQGGKQGINISGNVTDAIGKLVELEGEGIANLTSALNQTLSQVTAQINSSVKELTKILTKVTDAPSQLFKCLVSLDLIKCLTGLLTNLTSMLTALPTMIANTLQCTVTGLTSALANPALTSIIMAHGDAVQDLVASIQDSLPLKGVMVFADN